MAEATIRLEIDGAQEVLNALRQIQGFTQGNAGAPLPVNSPVVTSGQQVAQAVQPPPSGTNPAALSVAGQVAGTPMAGAQTSAIPATVATPPQAGGMGVPAFLGGAAAGQALQQVGMTAAGQFGQAATGQRVWDPFDLAKGTMQAGMIAAGAMIGSVIPGVGTLVGAGVGAVVGGITDAFISPVIDAQRASLAAGAYYYGNGYTPLKPFGGWGNPEGLAGISMGGLQASTRWFAEGRPINSDTLRSMAPDRNWYTDEATLNSYHHLRFGRASIARFGAYAMNDPNSGQFRTDVALESMYDDPFAAAGFFFGTKRPAMAYKALNIATKQIQLEDEYNIGSARTDYASAVMAKESRYGSSDNTRQAAESVGEDLRDQARILREKAKVAPRRERPILEWQAKSLELQASMVHESDLSQLGRENSANTALDVGRANRAFDTALYSGASARDLPFEGKAKALNAGASRLEKEMEERRSAGLLSTAMEVEYRERIEDMRFQAGMGIAREREGMVNRETLGRAQLAGAQDIANRAGGIMRGPASEQHQMFDLQAQAAERQLRAIQEILQTSKYLTMEQKLQLQTQAEQLKVTQEQAKVASITAKYEGRAAEFSSGQIGVRSAATIAALEAASPSEITGAAVTGFRATQQDAVFFDQQADDMIKDGLDPKNPQVLARRNAANQARASAAQQRQNLSIVQFSPESQEKMATLGAAYAISQMGYGTFGDVRGNLQDQMKVVAGQIGEIDQREASLKSQGIPVTAQMRANLQIQRAGLVTQYAGLMNAYDEGWDQRIISEAYNMPTNGRLFMSRFTHREAAMSGLNHRAFGGSLQQTEQMRMAYPRMVNMLNSGSPAGFTDRAMGEAMKSQTLNINLRVIDDKGQVRETSIQVANDKTSQDVNFNVAGRSRPMG